MMQVDAKQQWAYDANKNAHLKPRHRFRADLEDLQTLCAAGYESQGLRLKGVEPGEDDGSFVAGIVDKEGNPVVDAVFLISDTSDYPKDHSMFCHSLNPDIPSHIEALLVSVVEEPPRPLKEAIDSFLSTVADAITTKTQAETETGNASTPGGGSDVDEYWEASESDPDPDSDSDSDSDSTGDDQEVQVDHFESIKPLLQREFVDIVGSSFKPGLIPTDDDKDFIMSVSIPVTGLAEWIPQGALAAWGFLQTEHLVLLISGFNGICPILQADGMYSSTAQKASAKLAFRVGLSPSYKPGRRHACDALRKHSTDAEHLDRREAMAPENEQDDQGDGDAKAKQHDEDAFREFSLSAPLESLMDQAFLRVLQYRRRFGLGWAGADALLREMDDNALPSPEDALSMFFEIVTAAQEAEAELSDYTFTPDDPLAALPISEPINLPIASFTYLIRHLTLCRRYCISCHSELITNEDAPAPYTCSVASCSRYKLGTSSSMTTALPSPHAKRPIAPQLRAEVPQHAFDDVDKAIFDFSPNTLSSSAKERKGKEAFNWSSGGENEDMGNRRLTRIPSGIFDLQKAYAEKAPGDWKHDPDYVQKALGTFTPPPFEASGPATIALQKELMLTLREQKNAKSLKELGWYLPTEQLGDNLYQWIVEMHSFDDDLPIAKDMAKHSINSIVFEVRFLPSFPMTPPFFRIVTPRLLRFFRGGGGNVTSGGSICIDMLTSAAWVPSYTLPAILVQVRLAITNTDPRPARLADDWQKPYSVEESLDAFKRTAGNHGWKVPDGLDKLVS